MDIKRKQSLKKAQDKYVKDSTRTYSIRYNKSNDADVIAMLDLVVNKQAYIRDLIRQDIIKNGGNTEKAAERSNNSRVVDISYDEGTDMWKAVCKRGKINIKSDSYDVLLNKLDRAIEGKYTVKTMEMNRNSTK